MAKTVLVTGSSKGIGRAIVESFAKNNYNVVINYLNSEKEAKLLEQKLLQSGFCAIALKADVSCKAQVDKMVFEAKSHFGEIDILVNNAGISSYKLFNDTTENDWDIMMSTNLKSIYNCCKAIVPDMINKKEGKIINISSIWGITGASCEVSYSTSKAGIIGFTKALAKELGPSNIQVNCIAPGAIQTDMLSSLTQEEKQTIIEETPLQRLGMPKDVADLVYFLASPAGDFITGQIISPNGGVVI